MQKIQVISVFQLIKLKPCETKVSEEEMLEQAGAIKQQPI